MKGGVYSNITRWYQCRVWVSKLDVPLIGLHTQQKQFTCKLVI